MRVREALPEDLETLLVQPIRQVDVDEWVLSSGQKLSMALLQDVPEGSLTRALLDERGLCICLWGVTEDADSGMGIVWLIATEEAERRGRAIHRFWRRELRLFHEKFRTLVALSYHRNALHHDWLRAIGFESKRLVQMGPFSTPYAAYVRRQETTS